MADRPSPLSEDNRPMLSDGAFLFSILIASAVLRVVQLGAEGLWFDETNSVVISQLAIPDLLERIAVDNQAPLYFLSVKLVTWFLGTSEWAVRSASVAAGLVSVWLAHDVGCRLLTPRAGRVAAILVASSPMAIHYSQEARCYALLTLLVLMGFRVAWELDARPRASTAIGLGLVFLAIALVHNIGPFYIAGIIGAFVLCGRHDRRRMKMWSLAIAVTGLGYLFWLPSLVNQLTGMGQSFGWASEVWRAEFPWQLPRSLAAMTHGSLAPIRNRVPDILSTAWIGLGLCMLLWLAGMVRRSSLRDVRAPFLLAGTALLPLAGMWLYSVCAEAPVYLVGRVDSPSLPLLLLLTASGTVALGRFAAALVPTALVGLAILPLQIHWSVDFRSQERNYALVLDDLRSTADPLITTAFDCSFIHYGGFRHGKTMILFPSTMQPLLNWADWRTLDSKGAAQDAAEVVDRAVDLARHRGARRVWLFLRPDRRFEAIEWELDRRFRCSSRVVFPGPGYSLSSYEIPGWTLPGGTTG